MFKIGDETMLSPSDPDGGNIENVHRFAQWCGRWGGRDSNP